ncbi:ADP-ribosylglycohydrolase-like protein [Wilcoxina mikolae CBS 423.85]|nr:ADP-ribosylglycohydrolase-like protein [Wilcoxina mikolae CBS 423.85]
MTTPLSYLSLHPFVRSTVLDKLRGTIIGSALGDAIGIYTEFLSAEQSLSSYPHPITLLPPTPFRGDTHRDKFTPGSWTDDTDHSLLLLLSYLHHNGVLSPLDFAARLKSWCSQGLRVLDRLPLGLGRTVKTVVDNPVFLADPTQAAKRNWINSRCENAANGSLMRTHVLGVITLSMTKEEAFGIAMEVGQVTHFDPRCVVACCIVTAVLRGMLRGEVVGEKDVDEIVEDAYTWVCEREWGEETKIPVLDRGEFEKYVYATEIKELQLDDARTMGYVYKALGAALLLLRRAMRAPSSDTGVFKRLIQELVMAGGDADTNACVAGALVGCWVGFTALPTEWREGIQHREWLLEKTEGLAEAVGVVKGGYRGSEDPDTAFDGGKGILGEEELRERGDWFLNEILKRMKEREDGKKAEEDGKAGSGRWGKWIGR